VINISIKFTSVTELYDDYVGTALRDLVMLPLTSWPWRFIECSGHVINQCANLKHHKAIILWV